MPLFQQLPSVYIFLCKYKVYTCLSTYILITCAISASFTAFFQQFCFMSWFFNTKPSSACFDLFPTFAATTQIFAFSTRLVWNHAFGSKSCFCDSFGSHFPNQFRIFKKRQRKKKRQSWVIEGEKVIKMEWRWRENEVWQNRTERYDMMMRTEWN